MAFYKNKHENIITLNVLVTFILISQQEKKKRFIFFSKLENMIPNTALVLQCGTCRYESPVYLFYCYDFTNKYIKTHNTLLVLYINLNDDFMSKIIPMQYFLYNLFIAN